VTSDEEGNEGVINQSQTVSRNGSVSPTSISWKEWNGIHCYWTPDLEDICKSPIYESILREPSTDYNCESSPQPQVVEEVQGGVSPQWESDFREVSPTYESKGKSLVERERQEALTQEAMQKIKYDEFVINNGDYLKNFNDEASDEEWLEHNKRKVEYAANDRNVRRQIGLPSI
jgi:hypothetical protein